MNPGNLHRYFILLIFFFFSVCNWVYAQNAMLNTKEINQIADKFYLLSQYGCNIVVMAGPEGLLLVDSGTKEYAFKTDSVVSTISDSSIKYVLNTHFHFDHVGGNMKLSETGATIIANEETRKRMLSEWNIPEIQGMKYPKVLPYSDKYLPVICFEDSLKLFFNNEIVQAISYPNAHSDCDVIYYFQASNIIHAGDLFFSNGFPVIDIYYGGTIAGYIRAIDSILELCNEKTIIIPGHGVISNRQKLNDYRNMLVESKIRIFKLIKEGKTLDEVIAANPTKDLLKEGESWIPINIFVNTVYQDLSKK
ncbi:MBL fold metallo-hydrolase [Marinilabilia salmonicolor]|uniref:MBL fold metallo-hydrolase n=1 Tax=Marinilabilia salmonicolor TaxID=989 RepID=UPI00029A9723|nr:MBL fold metallo-hydrolase [Marinilabilia salmonicolor]